MSDVFGSLVKQWSLEQDAESADWLIGAEIFTPSLGGDALRSMKAPGEAYNNNLLGKDPQPASMEDFQNLPDTRAGDFGGVHINSGIPNKAFYLVATAIGGNAWDAPGHIWYETLTRNCGPQSQFQDFADATFGVAGRLYGASSPEQQAVRDAWREVGIQVAGGGSIRPALVSAKPARRGYSESDAVDSLAALQRRVDDLAKAVDTLTKKMHAA
jgi:Zn-dependent metalloprotease